MTNHAHILHDSVRAGDVPKVQQLIDAGYDVDYMDSIEMCTPLVLAAQYDNLAMVRMLLERGADVQSVDYEGCSPLYHASFYQHEAVMDCLMAHRADVSAVDRDGASIVSVCAMLGRTRALRKLILAGADLEVRDNNLDNALALAAYHRQREAVKMLVPHCIDKDTALKLVNDDGIMKTLLGDAPRLLNTCTLSAKLSRTSSRSSLFGRFFNMVTVIAPIVAINLCSL